MPVLSWAPRRARARIVVSGRRLQADPAVPYLSAAHLIGLLLNSALGSSCADPTAGIVLAVIAVKEAVSAWKDDRSRPQDVQCAIGPVVVKADDRQILTVESSAKHAGNCVDVEISGKLGGSHAAYQCIAQRTAA